MTLMKKESTPTPVARDMNRIRNRLQRFFEEPIGLNLRWPSFDEQRIERMVWSPLVEATELPKEYVITAELPGISPENVEVSMSDGMLKVKGNKLEERDEKERTLHLWERSYGEFERTFRFPIDVVEDRIAAEFKNGILTVKVPKVEMTPPVSRTIPIAKT